MSAGQVDSVVQTPCVPDRARAVFDRRFLPEEGFEATRAEIVALLRALASSTPGFECDLRDLMVVQPSVAPDTSPLIASLRRGVSEVTGRSAQVVASPGTYDQKHVAGIAGVEDCVAYGPGVLEMAHRPDEWCGVDALLNATKVLALTLLDLCGSA
jgi:succinyl-diaminopimelate desuccinylase